MAENKKVNGNYKSVMAKLKERPICPIFILEGEDTYLIDKVLSELKMLSGADFGELNYTEYFPPMSIKEAMSEADNMPFMSDYRVIVIRDYGKINAEEKKLITAYIKKPNPSTVLLFLNCDDVKSQSRNTYSAALYRLYPEECRRVVKEIAEGLGLTLKNDVAETLVSYKCANLGDISKELIKLKAYCYPSTTVQSSDIEAVVTSDIDMRIFDLTAALTSRDMGRAYRIVNATDMSPHQLMPALALFYTVVACVLSDDTLTPEVLAGCFQKSPNYMRSMKNAAGKYELASVNRILGTIFEMELLTRNGDISDSTAINRIIQIISSEGSKKVAK